MSLSYQQPSFRLSSVESTIVLTKVEALAQEEVKREPALGLVPGESSAFS